MRGITAFVSAIAVAACAAIAGQQYDNGGAAKTTVSPNWYYGAKVIGAYNGVLATGTYSDGMAADEILLSVRYTGDNDLLITSASTQFGVVTKFSTEQFVGARCFKATSFTAADTGGTSYSDFFLPTDSDMPSISGATIMVAGDGTTGLTEGTRTVGSVAFRGGMATSTDKVAQDMPNTEDFPMNRNATFVLHKNEGLECLNSYEVSGGSFFFIFRLHMLEVSK